MDQEFDLRFYLNVLRRRLYLIFAIFVVFSGTAFAIAVLWPPTYRSEAKFIVESQQIPPDLVRSTVSSYADERLQVIQQRITSRDTVMGLVDKLNLYPEKRKELTPTELYDLVRESIQIERLDLTLINRNRRDSGFTLAFTASFDHRSPQVAAAVANELVTFILNENVKSRTSRAAETTRFIQAATDKRRAELNQIEVKISQIKLANDQSLPEKQQFQMSRLESAKAELAKIDKDIQVTQEQQRLLEFELNVRSTTPNDASNTTASPGSIAKQLDAAKAELARKRSIYTDSHPDIRALKEMIAALEAQERGALPVASGKKELAPADSQNLSLGAKLTLQKIKAVKARRAYLQQQRDTVAKSVDDLNKVIANIPEVQSLLGNLERQRDMAQKQLDDLTAKLNEAQLGQKLETDQQGERFQVIEQPIVPTDPIKPKRPLILLAGVGLSGAAALGMALLLELINRTVHSGADIIRALGQPPLGTIPYFTTMAERRRKRIRIAFGSLTMVMSVVAALAAIHFFYMPLDVVFYKVLNRLQV